MPQVRNQHVVRQIEPSSDALRQRTLQRVDYADAFLIDRNPAIDRTAEQWVRSMLEDAPLSRRLSLLGGWTAIGLRLHSPRSSTFVLGWEVRRNEPDVVLLGAGSRFGIAGELLFERQPNTPRFSTLVQLKNPAARAAWAAIIPTHCRVIPTLLSQATRREAQG